MCSMRGRAGQIVGQGFSGKKTQLGVKMSKTVKKIGCLNLKTMIEENFQYYWNESYHRYFPDFKLIDYDNVFIEVKGYERDRDKAKWEQFPHKLIIIKKEEIEKLKTNKFQLTFENLTL